MKKSIIISPIALLLCFVSLSGISQIKNPKLLTDNAIRQILKNRVKEISPNGNDIGIIVGIMEPTGRRVISFGHVSKDNRGKTDGNTAFEIGSVTKVFTALLLCRLLEDGKVSLADPVSKYLPGRKIPESNGRPITLLDLATHTSGLAFMPPGSKNSQTDLYRYLSSYKLPYDAGSGWEYSNLGYWLLSEALASILKTDYKSALQKEILSPMMLTNTAFELSAQMKENMAVGHDASLQPSPLISSISTYSIMPAAGGLFSTANDLLRVLAIGLNYDHSTLTTSFAKSISINLPAEQGSKQALGWTKTNDLIFRDGGTFGFASCMMFDPVRRVGVVVLSNQSTSVSDIARHLLKPNFPLAHPVTLRHHEKILNSVILQKYAGNYRAVGEGIFEIKYIKDSLMFNAPSDWGLPVLRIHAESSVDFFAKELPLRIKFQCDNHGRVSRILISPPRGQKIISAQKVSD